MTNQNQNKKTRDYYVYIWYNDIKRTSFYVGMGRGNRYKVCYNSRNRFVNQLIKDIGISNVSCNIVWRNLKEIDALYIEEKLIAFLGRKINNSGILLNLAYKGSVHKNFYHSLETRKKISNSLMGHSNNKGTRWPLESRKAFSIKLKGKIISEDAKKKISQSLCGPKHPNFGKKISSETKNKISESVKRSWKKRKRK